MERDDLLAELADLLSAVVKRKLTKREIVERLDRMSHSLQAPEQAQLPGVPASEAPPRSTEADDIQTVFQHWRRVSGHTGARLLPERAQKIRARLRDFTVRDLLQAVDGCMLSGHHMGDNDSGEKYDWIETIMRNGSAVEKHMDRASGTIATTAMVAERNDPRVIELRGAIAQAQETGDVDRGNKLNAELRRVLLEARPTDHAGAG